MEQCAIVLASSRRPQGILEGDIKSCCDKISHDWLVQNIPMDKRLLRTWLNAGYMDKSVLYPTEEGTPQGGPISPVLATMALDGLERMLRKPYPHAGPKAAKGKNKHVNLVRYCDDFVITGISKEVLATEVKPLVRAFLQERGLALSPEKTTMTPIEDGFDFLGQHVRKYNGHFLTRPSKKNVKTFLTDIRKLIKANKQAPAYWLIAQLSDFR